MGSPIIIILPFPGDLKNFSSIPHYRHKNIPIFKDQLSHILHKDMAWDNKMLIPLENSKDNKTDPLVDVLIYNSLECPFVEEWKIINIGAKEIFMSVVLA